VLADWMDKWKAGLRRVERVVRPRRPGYSRRHTTKQSRAKAPCRAPKSRKLSASTGLAKFLYNHKVPGIQSAQCRRGAGEETPRHMALYCTEEAYRQLGLRTNGRVNYQQLIGTASGAKRLARWLICSERLGQFSLARSLLCN
jgi:hypothetical protein